MWVLHPSSAPRVTPRRFIVSIASALFAAIVLCLVSFAQPAAAVDAQWANGTLTYQGNTYSPVTNPPNITGTDSEYQWIDGNQAHVLYFSGNAQNASNAQLVTYNFTPPGTYTGGSSPATVTVTRDLTTDANDQNQTSVEVLGTEVETQSTCDSSITSGVGWIICPVSNWIADGVDGVYGFVQQFLDVAPITNTNNGIYQLWDLARNIANACFALVFLIIVYSYITGVGLSNYNIKEMLPRLLIGAVLVNTSFWIVGAFVDLSNLFGHSIHAILVNVRESLPTGANISWSGLTAVILAGGAGAATLGLAAATGFSLPALGFLLLSALITVGFGVLVAFVILAARQALIIIFLLISPLAFVAMILPNTRSLYEKWQKVLTTLLIFYPIFALLFGGSQLAGAAILNSTSGNEVSLVVALMGLAVQFVPLVLTPLLLQFSSGLLGRIANIANDRSKGMLDRSRGWAKSNADMHRQEKLVKMGRRRDNPGRIRRYGGKYLSPGGLALAMDQGGRKRELRTKNAGEYLGNRADADYHKRTAEARDKAPIYRRSERKHAELRNRAIDSHDFHKQAELYKGTIDAKGDEHWQKRFDPKSHHYDGSVHKADLARRQYKSAAQNAEDKYEAIMREFAAGVNSYQGGEFDGVNKKVKATLRDENMDKYASKMGELTFDISQQAKRKEYADIQIKSNEVQRLRSDMKAREYAGGIDQLGADKVLAKARSEHSALHMENVKAYGSIYTNEAYSAQELMNVVEKGLMRDGVTKANAIQQHAAVQRIMNGVGNNWAAQKIIDWSATIGLQEENGTYYEVDEHNNKTAVGNYDSEKVTEVRDMQQIINDAIKTSPLKVGYVSATQRSFMESGQYRLDKTKYKDMSEQLIAFEIKSGKYKAQRFAEMDPDEISRMVQVLRVPEYREELEREKPGAVAAVLNAINAAQSDPNIRGQIGDRERGLMNILASHLDPNDHRSERDKETTYFEVPSTDDPNFSIRTSNQSAPGVRQVRAPVQSPNRYTKEDQVDKVNW